MNVSLPMPEHDPEGLYPVIRDMLHAAKAPTVTEAAACAAAVEIARILVRLDGRINDEDRHMMIQLGGALLRLDQQLES